jgi:thiamine biosynthesis lipoprotein
VTDACIRRARPLLGTLVEISAHGSDEDAVRLAVDEAFRMVEAVQRLMSYHDPESDVSRINREAARQPVAVASHTWRVLDAAQSIARASDGLFDITVAPTLVAFGFLPQHADFPRASGQGDWRHVELLAERRVRLARRLCLDLGGIAKGYAVDRAIGVLQSHGMRAARVNAGGDLRVFGAPMQTVHIRRPGAPTELMPLVELGEGAAATSADYYTARRRSGRWVTPLIDPRTGVSCPRGRSVTVFAPDCMTADALTKVVHADPQRAIGILPKFSARALMLHDDDDLDVCKLYTLADAGRPWQTHWLAENARHV